MSGDLVALGLLVSLDNLEACSALGLLPLRRGRLHLFAAAFSLSELGATTAGLALGGAMHAALRPLVTWLAPAVLLGCGLFALVRVLRGDRPDDLVNGGTFLFGVPLSLGVDNLATGTGMGLAGTYPALPAMLVIGAIGAAMSCLGLYCGAWLRRRLPARVALLPAAYLCFLALRLTLGDHT